MAATSVIPKSRAAAMPHSDQRPPIEGEAFAAFELAELLCDPVYLGFGVPRGRGRSVLVLPGFLGGDDYLIVLRGWLQRIGYTPRASGIAFNSGTPAALLGGLLQRLEFVAAERPERMVVIGHSLGGMFARVLGALRPDLVAHVITLGSPVGGAARSAGHPMVSEMANMLLSGSGTPEQERAFEEAVFSLPTGPTVARTSIYSRCDAVVDWRACVDPDPRSGSAEVRGSHTGLAWNAGVYRALGPLLAASPL